MSENFLFLDRNSRNGLNYVKSIVVVLHSKGVFSENFSLGFPGLVPLRLRLVSLVYSPKIKNKELRMRRSLVKIVGIS